MSVFMGDCPYSERNYIIDIPNKRIPLSKTDQAIFSDGILKLDKQSKGCQLKRPCIKWIILNRGLAELI